MEAYQWWQLVGTARAKKVVAAAGVKWTYFRHIYKCRKCPSADVAERLARESKKESSGYPKELQAEMTMAEILKSKKQLEAFRVKLVRKK